MIITSSQISMDASSGHRDVKQFNSGFGSNRLPEDFDFAGKLHSAHLTGSQKAHSSVQPSEEKTYTFNSEYVLNRAIETLTGVSVHSHSFKRDRSFPQVMDAIDRQPAGILRSFPMQGQRFSMGFQATHVSVESDFLDFSSSGQVITADGRKIDFSLDLSVQSTRIRHESFISRASFGLLQDPLVLDFDSGLDTLSEHSFLFDLDGDGREDEIPGLGQGSGFLALDLDDDQIISSGLELFGPRSGSGFQDLAAYDDDGNNWIDENDPIFSNLLVWMNPTDGEQDLVPLKEAGVGAISLTNAGTSYNLKSASNILIGQVSAAGIFLTEDGEVKPLKDLQLALDDPANSSNEVTTTPEFASAIESLRSIIAEQQRTLDLLRIRAMPGIHKREEEIDDMFWKLAFREDQEDRRSLFEKYYLSGLEDTLG